MDRVAPLTGSVDRNFVVVRVVPRVQVAPLTGSVDRNITLTYDDEHVPGRSPHGERG